MFKLERSFPCANKRVFLVWLMNENAEGLGHKGHMWNIVDIEDESTVVCSLFPLCCDMQAVHIHRREHSL